MVARLDFITPLVYSQLQVDAVYFELRNAVYVVSLTLLLHTVDNIGLSPAFLGWFHIYLTSRLSDVRYREALSTLYEVLSGVP
jgi:hypothetical protein